LIYVRDSSPVDFSTAVGKATSIPGLSPAHVAFGNAIRAIRKEQGISQEAFALKCGLDRSYYGAVERGERNVSLTNIVRIAEALDTPLATIFASAEAASPVTCQRR
jgi:transcriptional regulator with XRE-family HTH domain